MTRHALRWKPLITALVTLAATGAGGCDALLGPPPEPPPPPPPPPPASPPPAPETCASWKPSGETSTLSADELRPLLGKLASSPEVKQALSRLGTARVEAAELVAVHTYERHGLQLFFQATGGDHRLDAVRLHGRSNRLRGFAGRLPEGLAFTQTEAEADAVLGGPERPYCWMDRCQYQERGVGVWSTPRKCLSTVDMTRPLQRTQLRVEDIEIHENVEDGGAHGVAIDVAIELPRVTGGASVATKLCLEDDRGKPLPKPRWPWTIVPDEGPLCLVLRTLPSAVLARARAFLPYVILGGKQGPFTLRGRFSSGLVTLSFGPSLPPVVPLEVIGETRIDARVTLPTITRARVSVRSARVAKGPVYDDITRNFVAAAIATGGATLLVPIPARWAKPDLQWTLSVAGRLAYRSVAHQDTHSATWSAAGSVPLAPGDRFSLCLEDNDGAGFSERIACFDFTAETYAAQLASREPLSKDHLEKLVLGLSGGK